jgi:hypothetical protein
LLTRIATTTKDPRMEMGKNQNGFQSWVASYPS